MSYSKRQVTLEQAVTEAIDSFVALNKSFSAHEVTVAVRNLVNQGDIEISGVPYGYVDASNTHSQMVTHADVRTIVQQISDTRKYDVDFSSGYRVYRVPVTPAPVSPTNPFLVTGSIEHRVASLLTSMIGTDPNRIQSNICLVDDLGCDDLDLVELEMAVEEEFNITSMLDGEISDKCNTVGDIVTTVQKLTTTTPAVSAPVTPANVVAVPQRFTVAIKDDEKRKVTSTIRRCLNNGFAPSLRWIQKNVKVSGLTVETLENVVKAEGFQLDTSAGSRSHYTVTK